MKVLKVIGIGLAVVLLVGVGLAFWAARALDPEGLKRRLIEEARRHRRTLTIGGDLRLSFRPDLGFAVDRVVLSEPDSAQEFLPQTAAYVAGAAGPASPSSGTRTAPRTWPPSSSLPRRRNPRADRATVHRASSPCHA